VIATRTFRIRRPRLILAVAGIGLAGSLLTGCAGATPALDPGAAAELQDGVLAVSSAAAAGDFVTAQTELGTVQAALTAASAEDSVTAARATEIQTAIDLVGADLAASIAASVPVEAPVEEPSPEPVSTPDDDDDDDNKDKDKNKDRKDKKNDENSNTPTPAVTPAPAPGTPEAPGDDDDTDVECENPDDCD
jgi:outer membrane biosynthesis protein TonB